MVPVVNVREETDSFFTQSFVFLSVYMEDTVSSSFTDISTNRWEAVQSPLDPQHR